MDNVDARPEGRFALHTVGLGQIAAAEDLAAAAGVLERMYLELCPPSRELSLALTNLQQAHMWVLEGLKLHGVAS